MLTRIRPRPLLELARRDLPAPIDVINLITTARFESYRWYALLVFPALKAVGAKVLWMGTYERSIAGEQQADKLLIVRYPSHRRFLAMTLNPYYLAINRFREAGVSRFEASFTHPSHSEAALGRRRSLIAVHFNSHAGENALDWVCELATPLAGELVYSTRAEATLGFLDPPRDTDPNPLTFGELALFAPSENPDESELAELATKLKHVVAGFSLQTYRREPMRTYRPAVLPGAGSVDAQPA